MTVTHELRHLENVHVVDHSGLEYFGCDQNWHLGRAYYFLLF